MTTKPSLLRWLHDFSGLFYPRLCLACAERQPPQNSLICQTCQAGLPRTDLHLHQDNAFTQRFWGRVPVYSGGAMFHFVKGGKTQKLLHRLKYEGKPQIGVELGKWYGRELKQSPWFADVQAIVPVPLHPRKERLRGYNQSDTIARGLSEGMKTPWYKEGLRRREFTETQTKKSRMERFGNVEEVFEVGNPAALAGKHILLVDDVMTTGATLEACARVLLTLPDLRISMATLAMAT
ncbi:MAG: ComF family protein [Saprospiraceae bacterium]|jgi:ComF family protein|nr:ComF family protein [Saprospiraceae bacterium]